MRTWWHEKILAARRRQEAFQAVVVVLHMILVDQIKRSLIGAHGLEEICRRHENSELELGLLSSAGYVHRIEAGSVHTDVNRRAIACS